MRDFYGTRIEIWAGFGPIGSTEKRVWADCEFEMAAQNYQYTIQIFKYFLFILMCFCK